MGLAVIVFQLEIDELDIRVVEDVGPRLDEVVRGWIQQDFDYNAYLSGSWLSPGEWLDKQGIPALAYRRLDV